MKRCVQIMMVMIVFLGLVHSVAIAQTDTADKVELIKDYRIDLLVKKQAQINRVAVFKNSNGDYKGYRIMVMNTNNRNLAYKTRSDILRRYPEQSVYMAYQSPYFKIKMGDFLKKDDALELKKELDKMFKQGVFVIQDIIKLTPEQEAELMEQEEDDKAELGIKNKE